MNFEEKTLKITAYSVEYSEEKPSIAELLEMARLRRATPLQFLSSELDKVDTGWTSGRLELDTELQPDNCMIGDYLYLTLRSACRKINAELLKVTIRQKCADYLKNNVADYVPSKVRKELKEEAIQALEPRAALCISNIPVVFCPNGTVYAGAATNGELDLLAEYFSKTFGAALVPVDAAALIGERGKDINGTTGREFLTWLLWRTEIDRQVPYMMDAPFDFVSPDDEKCNQATAKGGQVANSAEVRAALNAGKALRKAKFTLHGTEKRDIWTFTLNGDNFAFTGLKLPESEAMDAVGIFQERIDLLDELFDWLKAAFELFWEQFDGGDYDLQKKQWLNLR